MVGQNVVARLVEISTHLPWRLLHLTVLVSLVKDEPVLKYLSFCHCTGEFCKHVFKFGTFFSPK